MFVKDSQIEQECVCRIKSEALSTPVYLSEGSELIHNYQPERKQQQRVRGGGCVCLDKTQEIREKNKRSRKPSSLKSQEQL